MAKTVYFFENTATSGKYLWSTDANWSSTASPTYTLSSKPANGDTVTITAGTTCTFDNTDVYADGLASLVISGTLDAHTTAGAYVLKMAGNITGTGTFSAGSSGTAYPSNCSLTITFNGAFGFTTNLLYAVYCLEPTHKYVGLAANEASGQTDLTIDTDLTGDAVPWANGSAICINDTLGGDTELNTVTVKDADEITVGVAIDSANSAGAVVALVTRNITILGSGTTDIIKGWANGSYLRCCLRPAANSSSAINYSTNNTLTFDGVICPQSLTGSTGTGYGSSVTGGVTNAGLLIGVSRGFSSCSGFTNSGTISGNTNGVYSCSGFTNSGTISGNTNGVYRSSGVLYSTVFTGNTYDLRLSPDVRLYNCAMGSSPENYQYSLLAPHCYAESHDHDQSANAFKAWSKGGYVTSQTGSPPSGYSVYFRHQGESATYYCFKQVPYAVEAGKTLSVTGLAKLSATLASADDARLQIVDQFSDPLVTGGSALASASVADRTDSANWQTLAVNWTNSGTIRRLVWIRTIMRDATAYVDFCHKESDLPDVGNVLDSDTVNWVAGTFNETSRNTDPGVANVLTGAGNYKICNVTKTPTYHAPDAAEVIDTAMFGAGSATPGTVHQPDAAEVLDSAVYGPASSIPGTYHAPDASEVWHTAVFGPSSGTAGTMVGSDITNLEAGNIKSGVVIDDVTGSYSPSGPSTPILSISISGTTATATVTATAGVTVNLWQKATTDTTWILAGTRVGSGTITVSGLTAGMQYIFAAIATDGTLYSLPSIPVIVSLAEGFTGDAQGFDDGLIFLLEGQGEEIDFYPTGSGGSSRSILALVDRLGAQAVPGAPEGSTEVYRIVVLNDSVNGISTTEINCLKSEIGVPRRPGLSKQIRTICAIENQDEVGLQIVAA